MIGATLVSGCGAALPGRSSLVNICDGLSWVGTVCSSDAYGPPCCAANWDILPSVFRGVFVCIQGFKRGRRG